MLAEFRTGPLISANGAINPGRTDKTVALIANDAHGRFAEAARLQRLFSGGMTAITSISNATFTTATTGATATPIIGLWNPTTSGKWASILQVRLQLIVTAATATGPGTFHWFSATAQAALTLGTAAFNRYSLVSSGSTMQFFAGNALTGLSGSLTIREAAGLNGGPIGNFSMVGTAAGFITPATPVSIDNVDGGLWVPPGGLVGILCSTTPVAISAGSSILWEEFSADEI